MICYLLQIEFWTSNIEKLYNYLIHFEKLYIRKSFAAYSFPTNDTLPSGIYNDPVEHFRHRYMLIGQESNQETRPIQSDDTESA